MVIQVLIVRQEQEELIVQLLILMFLFGLLVFLFMKGNQVASHRWKLIFTFFPSPLDRSSQAGFYLTGLTSKFSAKCPPCSSGSWSIQGYYTTSSSNSQQLQLTIPTCTSCPTGTICSTTGIVLSWYVH